MSAQAVSYPLTFSVDYPDRELNRVTTGFRIILAIPVLLLLALFGRPSFGAHPIAGPWLVLFLPILALLVLRQKYPRWWFDFNVQLVRLTMRIESYVSCCATSTRRLTTSRPYTSRSCTPTPGTI